MTLPAIPRRQLLKTALATAAVPLVGIPLTACQDDSTSRPDRRLPTAKLSLPMQTGPMFLSDAEMQQLRALVATIVPADTAPGADSAGCAEAIQFLLSAFSFSPPMIFAGGPFSNRAGSSVNHFEQFIELDSYETLAWKLRIEGTQGQSERTFNGEQRGWQSIYREGLAALDGLSPLGLRFVQMPALTQTLLLKTTSDAAIVAMMDIAVPQTMEFMYGAPEYGGNADLVAWRYTQYEGDVQPTGYTPEQVIEPDNPGLLELLGIRRGENQGVGGPRNTPRLGALLPVPEITDVPIITAILTRLIAMGSDEFSLAMMIDGQSSRERITAFVTAKQPKAPGEGS